MLLQPLPPGFKNNVFIFSFSIPADEPTVWKWLNDTKTFTDTQYWPYKVEFYSPDPAKIPNGFNQGILTNHHGPFINFAGKLMTVEDNHYRDLQYTYGSYALSFRIIRPYRLEFKTEEEDGVTTITGTVSTYVKPAWDNFWTSMQKIFWARFQKWATKSITKLERELIKV